MAKWEIYICILQKNSRCCALSCPVAVVALYEFAHVHFAIRLVLIQFVSDKWIEVEVKGNSNPQLMDIEQITGLRVMPKKRKINGITSLSFEVCHCLLSIYFYYIYNKLFLELLTKCDNDRVAYDVLKV